MKDVYTDELVLFEINLADLNEEAKKYLGRKLKDHEIDRATDLLQSSTNEARAMIFSAVFDNLNLSKRSLPKGNLLKQESRSIKHL